MKTIKFKGYGVNSTDHNIIADRITDFYEISFNGHSGTCICLDTGKEINTEEPVCEVERKLEELND